MNEIPLCSFVRELNNAPAKFKKIERSQYNELSEIG